MKYLLLISLFTFLGCSNKYEVVQYLYEKKYHTQHIKTKEVVLYDSEIQLKPGDIIVIKKKEK